MAGERFRPNWPYLVSVVVIAAVGLGFIGGVVTRQVYVEWASGKAITGGWSWPGVAVVDGICFLLFLALLLKVRADVAVEISDAALSRPGWFRVRVIRWSEIREIREAGYGLHVAGETTAIDLSPYAYADPPGFVRRICEMAREHGAPV